MKVTVSHSDLALALKLCMSATGESRTYAITKCVRLIAKGDSLEVGKTDIEQTAITSVDAAVSTEGATVADAAALADIVKNASQPITMHATDGKMRVTSGAAEYELFVLPLDHYPTLPEMDDAQSLTFSASEILPMLNTCAYPMTEEEKRITCAGELIAIRRKRLDVVATDGHRLVIATMNGQVAEDCTVLLHRELVRSAKSLSVSPDATDVEIIWNDYQHGMRLGGDLLLHRQADISFPGEYRSEIPICDTHLRFETEKLLAAMRAASPFSEEEKHNSLHVRPLRLDLRRGELTISARSGQRGTSRITVAMDYSGEEYAIAFQGRFLIEPLETIHTRFVEFSLVAAKQDQSPLLIQPVDSELPFEALHVVMPLRL